MIKRPKVLLGRPTILGAVSFVAAFAVACGSSSVAYAQATSAISDKASTYVRDEMQRQHIPGLALLVARGGKIVQAE